MIASRLQPVKVEASGTRVFSLLFFRACVGCKLAPKTDVVKQQSVRSPSLTASVRSARVKAAALRRTGTSGEAEGTALGNCAWIKAVPSEKSAISAFSLNGNLVFLISVDCELNVCKKEVFTNLSHFLWMPV